MELTLDLACKYKNARIKTDKFIRRVIDIDFENESYILRATGGVISDAFVIPIKDCKLILKTPVYITDKQLVVLLSKYQRDIIDHRIRFFNHNNIEDGFAFDYWNSFDNKSTLFVYKDRISFNEYIKIFEIYMDFVLLNFDMDNLIGNVAIDENLL
jgi:hypothetical protein